MADGNLEPESKLYHLDATIPDDAFVECAVGIVIYQCADGVRGYSVRVPEDTSMSQVFGALELAKQYVLISWGMVAPGERMWQ